MPVKAISKAAWKAQKKVDLDALINQANDLLSSSRAISVPITISWSRLKVPDAAMAEFKAAFRAAGWKVELVSDQRERGGDFWHFS